MNLSKMLLIQSDKLTKSPLVSIRVLAYNQEQILPRCLESLLSQITNFDYEIIIGEDCSSDGTLQVCKEYQKRYPEKIVVCNNEKNLGILGNFVNVNALVRGKYLAACGGDDYWIDNEKLQSQVDIMEQDSSVGLVYTDVKIEYEAFGKEQITRKPDPEENTFEQLLRGNFITACTVMHRKELLSNMDYVFLRDKKGFIMEDYPTWLQFSTMCKFYHLPKVTAAYTVNKKEHVDMRTALTQALAFDENTTKIKLYYKEMYPDRSNMKKSDLEDMHYRRGAQYALILKDRQMAKKYYGQINAPNRYERCMKFVSGSSLLFGLYMFYRKRRQKNHSLLDAVYS